MVIPSEARDMQSRKEKRYYVYIMASRSLTHTGMCNDIVKRAFDHKEGLIEGFTKRYKLNRLVYYEVSKYVNNTINREKQIKKWSRAKKIALIRSANPTWRDLAESCTEKLQIPRYARDDNPKLPTHFGCRDLLHCAQHK